MKKNGLTLPARCQPFWLPLLLRENGQWAKVVFY